MNSKGLSRGDGSPPSPGAVLRRWLVLPLAVALLANGCVSTFKEVKPLVNLPPPKDRPTVLALGGVQVTDSRLPDAERAVVLQAFQLGVQRQCLASNSFKFLPLAPGTNAPAQSAVVKGNIQEVEKGSAAARFWVGMGAGQARIQGEFTVDAPDGTTLTKFAARKSYLGGSGIGGWDMMKTEELVAQLGELVVQTVEKWAKGQKIE